METHTYTVSSGSLPHLVINDDTGSITIHRGSSNSQVTIQATKHVSAFNSTPKVQYNQDGNTVTASVQDANGFSFGINNVDFDVSIPANADLQIHTDTGAINVNGVSGSMSLTTDTGAINATQDGLGGQSILKSDTGSVTYNGSIDPYGNYEFSTNTGAVDVTIPSNSSFRRNRRS